MKEPGDLQPPGARLKKLARQGGILFTLDLAVSFCEAGAAMKLWNWFVTPLGAPTLSFVHAFGLMLLLSFLHGAVAHWTAPQDEPSDEIYKRSCSKVAYRFVRTAFFLLIASVTYHFMH